MAEDEEGENWASLANPPEMIMKLMLLQKKQGFIDALMIVKSHNAKGATVDITKSLRWLTGLWLECGAILKRENPDLYDSMAMAIGSQDVNDHVAAFQDLMVWLDKKGLRWDVRGGYDKTKLSSVQASLNSKMS